MKAARRLLDTTIEDTERWLSGATRGIYDADEVIRDLLDAARTFRSAKREPRATARLKREICARLQRRSWSARELADDLGRRRETIALCLRELELDDVVTHPGDANDPTGGWIVRPNPVSQASTG